MKHLFDADSVALELSQKMKSSAYPGGYKMWSIDVSASENPSNLQFVPNGHLGVKRSAPGSVENTSKKKCIKSNDLVIFCYKIICLQ